MINELKRAQPTSLTSAARALGQNAPKAHACVRRSNTHLRMRLCMHDRRCKSCTYQRTDAHMRAHERAKLGHSQYTASG